MRSVKETLKKTHTISTCLTVSGDGVLGVKVDGVVAGGLVVVHKEELALHAEVDVQGAYTEEKTR